MSADINSIEGMPPPPDGCRWKLIVRFGCHFYVIAVKEQWPHLRFSRKIEGVVLYEQGYGGTPPPQCLIEGAHRYLRDLSEIEEDERRKEMLREYL